VEPLEVPAGRSVLRELAALLPLAAVAALGIDVLSWSGGGLRRKSQKQAKQRVGEKRDEYDGIAILLDGGVACRRPGCGIRQIRGIRLIRGVRS